MQIFEFKKSVACAIRRMGRYTGIPIIVFTHLQIGMGNPEVLTGDAGEIYNSNLLLVGLV